MRTRLTTALAVTAWCLGGCQADPSYRLRWEIETWPQPGETLAVNAAVICSKAGIFEVRARTFDAVERLVDERAYACFAEGFGDPAKLVDGPTLPPGEYLVELRGLTRAAKIFTAPIPEALDPDGFGGSDDSGITEPDDDDESPCSFGTPSCGPVVSCDCKLITAAEGSIVAIADFVVGQPPQCIDGLDNDGDGAVDRQDPACAGGFVGDAENADIERTTLSVQFSFFDNNPNVTCGSVGVDEIVVDVDGIERIREACTRAPIRRSFFLEAGTHEVSATLAVEGNEEAVIPVTRTFEVRAGLGGALDVTADFAASAFTPPIEREIAISPEFLRSEALPPGTFCLGSNDANVEVATLRIGLRDGHGGPIPPVILEPSSGLGGDATVIPSGGTVDVDCFSSVRNTEPLVWGDYIVSFEALSAEGEVCFSNGGGTRAAPGTAFSDPLPRVFPVPTSCRDCDPGECQGALVCNDGVCVEPCATDQDCDTDQACVDTLCGEAPAPE